MSNSVRRELSNSVRRELSNSVRRELSNSVRRELSNSVRRELSNSVRRELSNSVRRELSNSVRRELSGRRKGRLHAATPLESPVVANAMGEIFAGLADSSGMKAFVDATDDAHDAVVRLVLAHTHPYLTSMACVTETLHLLRRGGWPLQSLLWKWCATGRLIIAESFPKSDLDRCAVLMETYRDRPCDFADASLVALAERTGITTVLTLDSDFYIYRLQNGASLLPVPGTAEGG